MVYLGAFGPPPPGVASGVPMINPAPFRQILEARQPPVVLSKLHCTNLLTSTVYRTMAATMRVAAGPCANVKQAPLRGVRAFKAAMR